MQIYKFGAHLPNEASDGLYANDLKLIPGAGAVMMIVATVTAWRFTRGVQRQRGVEPDAVAAVARQVGAGDLRSEIWLRSGDTHSVMAEMKQMRDRLAAVVADVRQRAKGVATASAEISQGNNDLSGRTEQQAAAIEQTATSMEELCSAVRQNADNARQANQLAMGADAVAVKGGAVVGPVVETMKGINDSSKRMADITGVIDGIAFPINNLPLNAAVEAAGAGERGRGFAVVAAEVRSLAQLRAAAAKELKGLISASVERVEQCTALVDQAGVTMTEWSARSAV